EWAPTQNGLFVTPAPSVSDHTGWMPRRRGWRISGQGVVWVAERFDQLQVRAVVDGAGDHRDRIGGQGGLQRLEQAVGRGDPVPRGAAALGVRDDVRGAAPTGHSA